ncbi:MAG: hypothetical protein P8I83_00810 [Paracoccaceae bacterium]|nr:hypothetical protein [Paracoccaceae bacterium]
MLVTGETDPFLEHLEVYLEDTQVESKTKQMKRMQIMDYADTGPLISDTTYEVVTAFIKALSKDHGAIYWDTRKLLSLAMASTALEPPSSK